jgi:hypothetical protein
VWNDGLGIAAHQRDKERLKRGHGEETAHDSQEPNGLKVTLHEDIATQKRGDRGADGDPM